MRHLSLVCGSLGAVLALSATVGAAELDLEVGALRSGPELSARMDAKVRDFARNVAQATAAQRERLQRIGRWSPVAPFSLPTTLYLTSNGRRLGPSPLLRGGGGSITLAFDDTGPRSFPPTYKQTLIDTFAQAQSTINAIFGQPAFSATIHVRNFDADIGDRDAVAGGYYVPDNGSSEQEIRFPVYTANETAAVNFIHCLLLAYMGPNGYGFDAFKEGLVRASAMRVARTAGALPSGLDQQIVESVLDNTYDVGTFYDWYNQKGLSGAKFIAPNLRDTQLPPGGSLGGVYLLRYQMSGSAWQKVLVEYPAFAAALNAELYGQPSLASDIPGLVARAQVVMNGLIGSGSATIEGNSFANWFVRQNILDTQDTLGLKLICQPTPLPPIGGSDDFGVFDVTATYFETLAGGNETLLSGVCYPLFWSPIFDRVIPSAQEERMDIAGAYGSVAPNLPNLESGDPYRMTIDLPVQDRIARAYVPAGGIATGANTTPNDFYGTVVGANNLGSYRVRLTYGVTVVDNIPVTHWAFGSRINTSGYLAATKCRIEVIQTIGQTETTVIDRRVNKGPGPLALDLRVDDGDAVATFGAALPKGLSTIGLNVEPYSSSVADILGLPTNQALIARWNGAKTRFDLFPDTGSLHQGAGYFVRLPGAIPSFTIPGRTSPNVPIAVALRPGWNMISNPTSTTLQTTNVTVAHAADTPKAFADALGSELGLTFFEFTPGANDAATGAPETGTMTPATQFSPGRMYFVRTLVAEGATLLFTPTGPGRAGSGNGAAPPSLLLECKVLSQGRTVAAIVGQSATATAGFDAREDAGAPPGSFGLSATVDGGKLYRDLRGNGVDSIYSVRFEGLQPNAYQTVTFKRLVGTKSYFVRQPGSALWKLVSGNATYRIRPATSTVVFEVKVTS